MYLLDTNIFLEILLSQKKSAKCKKVLSDNAGSICISDFSLHSIGVILFRYGKEPVFNDFMTDVISRIDIISLSTESYINLSEIKDKYNLDFDDSYQFKISEEKGLAIITMDKDFERVNDKVKVRFV